MKKKLSYVSAVVLNGVLPLLIASVILCIISISRFDAGLEESTYNRLKVAADDLRKYYLREMSNGGEITYGHDYVDSLKDQEIELTLFVNDTRYITSIVDAETGERIEGSKADEKIYQTVSEGNDYRADGVVIGGSKYFVYYMPIIDASGNFVGMAFAGESDNLITSEKTSCLILMVAAAGVVAVVCAAVVVIFCMISRKAVLEVENRTEELSNGILYQEIHVKSFIREFAMLGTAVSRLQENMRRTIGAVNEKTISLNNNVATITEGVNTSNQAADGIVSAVDELAKGSLDMAESVQNTAGSMQNIGNGIASISALANSANDSAKEVETISQKAKDSLEELIQANQNTIAVSDEVVNGIHESSMAIEDIRKAADVIADIASQTNLLSLNASIEAARAGEAGRGFAVVATSIQNLANQSDASTKEIKEVIENIIAKSDINVELANQIKSAIDHEGSVLKEVNDSFDEVNNRIAETADAIGNITEQADALNNDKAKILDEVSTLSSISEENAASCEETTASMQELSANIATIDAQAQDTEQISADLKEAVSYFKLEK